jgi:hypothetical protein
VEQRERFGDTKVDLIIGGNHQGGLLVILYSVSLKITINKIDSKVSKKITALILK